MKEMNIWTKLEILFIVIILVVVLFEIVSGTKEPYKEDYRTYNCDYKSSSLIQTKITTKIDDKEVTIKGNVMALITDPLVMLDYNNKIAYAGDVYGFISQDDHGIYVNDKFEVNMEGKVDIFGNTYHLKDENGNVIATIDFNVVDTNGTVTDNAGNIIATYNSNFAMKDYKVKICDNDVCSDTAMLMIIASYVSDKNYDNN